MNVAFQRNIGSFIKAVSALAAVTVTAGGGSDGVAQNGVTFDRETLVGTVLSALAVVHVEAALAEDETAEISIAVQDSDDGSAWATYSPGPPDDYTAQVFSTDGHHVASRKIQLGGARRYVRIQVTATMSASGTDTAKLDGVFVVAGADELPIAEA